MGIFSGPKDREADIRRQLKLLQGKLDAQTDGLSGYSKGKEPGQGGPWSATYGKYLEGADFKGQLCLGISWNEEKCYVWFWTNCLKSNLAELAARYATTLFFTTQPLFNLRIDWNHQEYCVRAFSFSDLAKDPKAEVDTKTLCDTITNILVDTERTVTRLFTEETVVEAGA